jgi:hypothetical protein
LHKLNLNDIIFDMPIKSQKTKVSEKTTETASQPVKKEKIQHSRPALTIIALLIILFAFLYLFKGLFIAADVNGEKISRFAVISALEKQAGKQTLENMITKTLILQEAKKRNINISDTDVNKEIAKISKNIEAQGSTLDQALSMQGMTRNQLKDEIKLQLMVQKMVSQNVKVSDSEVAKFIEENKTQFPDDATEEELKTQAKEQLTSQKMSEQTQKLISNLQKNAKTVYFIKY